MTHYNRHEIGLRPREPGPGLLTPARVRGIAFHWPGVENPIHGVTAVKAALRQWQALHMDTDQIAEGGASDIAYQRAIDQAGNTYGLRGLRHQSGANGSTEVNEAYGAVLLVLAIGEAPSEEMIAAARRTVAGFRERFPQGTAIVGHRDVRPEGTQCPGDKVMALIHEDRFRPHKARR